MSTMRNIVILTGAGISAESGLRTFRAADGLWEDHRIEDVATPEAFARDPALVHRFYDARRANLA
ncbi:MAG: Sir2 family NAD-dependent protein deacetylase, partial [Sphingomicrobium sp.]